MLEIGNQAPDFTFVTETGTQRRLSELCPGAAVLIFLRHLA